MLLDTLQSRTRSRALSLRDECGDLPLHHPVSSVIGNTSTTNRTKLNKLNLPLPPSCVVLFGDLYLVSLGMCVYANAACVDLYLVSLCVCVVYAHGVPFLSHFIFRLYLVCSLSLSRLPMWV